MRARLWMNRILAPLVVMTMVGLVAQTVRSMGQQFFPAWSGGYYVALAMLAALEACYSQRLSQRILAGDERLRFRLIEIALLFLLVRFGKLLGNGSGLLMADLRALLREPLLIFADAESVLVFVLVLVGWNAATNTIRELDQLSARAEMGALPRLPGDESRPMEFLTEDQTARSGLVGRFFMGGVVALIAAGLARIGIADLLELDRPAVPGLIGTVLVYFLLGLVLVGVVQFATLRKQWNATGVGIRQEVPQRWVRYTLGFVALATFIAFLLPTGYTIGPLEALALAVDMVLSVFAFIGLFIFYLFTLPIAWLFSILTPTGSEVPPQPAPLPPTFDPLPQTALAPTPPWIEILRSFLFWILIVALIVYVVRAYLRDHPELQQAVVTARPVQALRRWWTSLKERLEQWRGTIRRLAPRTPTLPARQTVEPQQRQRGFRLRGEPPREQVLFYYRSLLRRAEQQGLPRQQGQTPYEYDTTLEGELPGAEAELDALARAFVEARYSEHPVEVEQARKARAEWQRVKAALHARKRQQDGPERKPIL